MALFIEPIGIGEYVDGGKLKANKKVYYDKLFKKKGLKTIKEGRFTWHKIDEEFEHYTSTDWQKFTVPFNRAYFWVVS